METFKDIIGWEGLYQISNLGNVKSLSRIVNNHSGLKKNLKEKFLKKQISKTGYYVVDLKNNNFRKTFKVHRLIAIHFINNPLNKGFVNHIDGNKLNNDICNLEWCTISENNKHAELIGLKKDSGVYNSRAKLNINDILFIRNSTLKIKELSEIFNINKSGISKVRLYKTYK